MCEKEIDKYIGYCVVVIIGYYIIGLFINFVIVCVVGLVMVRIYIEKNR